MLGLLAYYAFTWIVGGVALFFLLRSVGADPGVSAIPFLGGTSAVGAHRGRARRVRALRARRP